MGDKPSSGCRQLHPNYREVAFKFIIPRDLNDQEILRILSKCLYEYAAKHSKYGYKEPYYIEEDDFDCF